MPAQLIRRVRGRQPQPAVKIDFANPITRSLSSVIRLDTCAEAVKGKLYTATGTKLQRSSIGTGRGFGSTDGAGTTDKVLTDIVGTQGPRTYFVLAKLNGWGGGNFGRFIDGTTLTQELFYVSNAGNGGLIYYRSFSGGPRSALTVDPNSVSNQFGKITSYSVSFDASSPSNQPELYIAGTRYAFASLDSVPTGTANSTGAFYIGNRGTDNARNIDGTVYLVLVFDRMLSAAEHKSLTRNPWQVFAPETIPLFWTGVTAQSATASIAAAIRADRTASASLSAAIQSAATASATLSSAIQTAQSATSGLTAYIVASSARSSSASLSAAISDARTATSSLSAAVAAARIATAALDSAVQIEVTASTGVSAAIREAFSISANLSGAVQASATASASLAAVVAKTNAISSDLSAAVRAERTASAGLSTVIAASVWPNAEDVKQGVVYGPQGFDYTGEFAGGGGPITRVMQGAEPETIIKTVVRTVYVDRPAASQIHDKRLLNTQEDEELADTRARLIRRKLLTEAFSEHQTTIKAQEVEIASLRSENEALAALLMATMQ